MTPKSAVLALAVVVLSGTGVQALPTTYVYTGNPFIEVSGPYTTSDFVTAMITLASPLAPNFSGFVSPTAFTFSDGVQTLTNLTADPLDFFSRQTLQERSQVGVSVPSISTPPSLA